MKLKHIKTLIFVMIFVVLAACSIYNIKKQSAEAPEIIQFFDKDLPLIMQSGTPEDQPRPVIISEDNVPEEDHLTAGLVNINTADQSELETLPGIGPVKAKAIIEYRKAYKGFVAPEEIMEVRGIGKATYQKIKELITIE